MMMTMMLMTMTLGYGTTGDTLNPGEKETGVRSDG